VGAHDILLYCFLACFALHFLTETILSVLNARRLKARRGEVPEPLRQAYSPDVYDRSVAYALAHSRFGHIERVVVYGLTALYLFSGLIPMLNELVLSQDFEPLTHGVAVLLLFSLLTGLLGLPLTIYETFWLEARFGFNRTSVRTFILDRVKGILVLLVLGGPFLYALLALITRAGELWWVWAALFVIGFQCLMMVLVPLVIAPLFNKFTPLEEGELKTRLEDLARQCDFAVRGIFLVDGSKRSGHSNAYFTGIGKARRIVLYDTLVQQLSVAELAAVLAHEIGHYKKKHILKMLALSSAATFAAMYALSLVLDWHPLFQAFGLAVPNVPKGLIAVSLIAGHLTFWLIPLGNWLSRRWEYQADAYARDRTGAEPVADALVKLYAKNLAPPSPHPLYSAYHHSHPTLLERVEALRKQ
jgi:STE24 endopeptidase